MFGATLLTVLVVQSTPATGLTVAAERLLLPSSKVKVEVDGMSREIRLRTREPKLLQKALKASRLCPDREPVYDGLLLRCQDRRITAEVQLARGQPWLDIRITRGLPWGGAFDFVPTGYGSPEMWNISELCPGISAAGRAECLFATGRDKEARKALAQPNRTDNETSLALLRRGEVASSERKFNEAISLFESIQVPGPAMRFADAHICEIAGNCFDGKSGFYAFEHQGLREPLQTEMELRALRLFSYLGHDETVLNRLRLRLTAEERPSLCKGAVSLCHSLVLAAMKSDSTAIRLDAIDLYASGLLPLKEGRNRALAYAASEIAMELGAPGFAANLLASAANEVAREELADYLIRTAELYSLAGDTIRTEVVVSFAQSKLSRAEWTKAQWKMNQLGIGQPRKPESKIESVALPQVDLAKELANVALLRSQLRKPDKKKENP